MSNATIIFLLTLCIMILICIIVYQQFVFHNGTKAKNAKKGNPFGASDSHNKSPEMMLNSKSFRFFICSLFIRL